MSLLTTLPAVITETILNTLTAIFLTGANGDTAAARDAASHMLAAYNPETEDELRLAASMIGFSFHALQALGQAAAPDIALTRILRLQASAVSLSREAAKAERRLNLLRQNRQQAISAPQANPECVQTDPGTQDAPLRRTGKIAQAARANGKTWAQAYDDRQRELRIAASLKRAEIRINALNSAAADTCVPAL